MPTQNEPLPENALIPFPWAIFTMWQHTKDELNKDFTQHLEVITPDGKTFATMRTEFKITEANDLQSKNSVVLSGIPIWLEGFITINVWLEGLESDKASYLFAVKYLPQPSEAQFKS